MNSRAAVRPLWTGSGEQTTRTLYMVDPQLSDRVFGDFRALIYKQAGIHLSPKKRSLVC